jgi:glycosyltransferase involved in cell wall biosynthesis
VRIVAMIQVYNEQRMIAACIEHLREQGVDVYLIDNESTDETMAIAERYLDQGVIGIETFPRTGSFDQDAASARKEEVAQTLDADWFIHHDADEMRVSPKRGQTLAEAIAEVDAAGFNAINFLEFVFVPTRESPNHDHPDFYKTMLWYYPYVRAFPHRLNAWKRQDGPVGLVSAGWGGHRVSFPGLKMAPESLYMRHYLFLSREYAVKKYSNYSSWGGWRGNLVRPEQVQLSSEKELRRYAGDHLLDPTNPLDRHPIEQSVASATVASRPRKMLRRLRRRVSRLANAS